MYKTQNFDNLFGIKGFSEELLKNHFKLYNGYVDNVAKLIKMLESLELGTVEYAEIKRRFAWEFNGMRLHELFFKNITITNKKLNEDSTIAKKIIKDFESLEKWEEDFKSTGAMRGIGWVILFHDKEKDKLFNVWINDHDVGHLTGTTPLLVMDVFEHAFMLDYNLNKVEYINTFFNAIDWEVVEKRLK